MNEQANSPSDATLVQIARLYYLENKSQQEIADEIGVSRSLVALYLKRARDRGIVSFEIRSPQDNFEYLERFLCERTGIARAVVVPTANNPALTRRSVASALARHLEDNLQDGDVLGVGFGRTMHELPSLIAPRRTRKISVVPLMGESASSYTRSYSQINQVVLQISQVFDGVPYFLLAPLLTESPELAGLLMKDASIRPVVDLWNRLDHVCIGIGTVPPVEGEVVYVGEENLAQYVAKGAVGDTCTRYFDAHGDYIQTNLHDRTIGIRLDQLSHAKGINILASGTGKADAILAFLKTGMVTNLFVDEELATVMAQKKSGA
jgi:deoxyribonucleoside regulator